MTRETLGRLAGQHPRIRAVTYYYQSIEDPFVFSVGQQRQAIQEWATEHDIEIMREFSQVGYGIPAPGTSTSTTWKLALGFRWISAGSWECDVQMKRCFRLGPPSITA